jgi:TRAP-type C4-dicarboxylate transport system permease small subunit
MQLLDKVLTFFEEWTLFITVLAAMLSLFLNVILRYAFSYSLAWSEELVREVILYSTFTGCSAAIKNRSTVRIDAFVQLLPKLKYPLEIFSYAINLLFAVMMIYFGYLLCRLQVESNQTTLILQIPTVYLYALLPLMGVMMLIRIVIITMTEFRARHSPMK